MLNSWILAGVTAVGGWLFGKEIKKKAEESPPQSDSAQLDMLRNFALARLTQRLSLSRKPNTETHKALQRIDEVVRDTCEHIDQNSARIQQDLQAIVKQENELTQLSTQYGQLEKTVSKIQSKLDDILERLE